MSGAFAQSAGHERLLRGQTARVGALSLAIAPTQPRLGNPFRPPLLYY
jgi:hypothetical protein